MKESIYIPSYHVKEIQEAIKDMSHLSTKFEIEKISDDEYKLVYERNICTDGNLFYLGMMIGLKYSQR